MHVLPIFARELRVQVRQSRTWWWRVFMAGCAVVVFVFVYFTAGSWASLSQVGRQVFGVLSGLGTFYALLAGPLSGADSLSRERREGTLGLLFLTNLKSYDVVVGKMAAGSLGLVAGALATLPLFAAPLLLGGISLGQFGCAILALLDVVCLSLAVGICASSFCSSGRTSLGITVAVLAFLTLGFPILGENFFGLHLGNSQGAVYYMFCPLSVVECCFDWPIRPGWRLWLNLAGVQGLAWICLAIACLRTRTSWREAGLSLVTSAWGNRLERWAKGGAHRRQAWRRRMLEASPVAWLEGRDLLQPRLLWGICLVSVISWCIKHLQSPMAWPDNDMLFIWPLTVHYSFCVWLAIQAPRRLADDKQSGALELLLCTPVKPAEISRGVMKILRHRFGRALFVLLALDLFLVYAHFSVRGWRQFAGPNGFFPFAVYGPAVLAFQGFALARVGLYQGLRQGNSLRASYFLLGKIVLLPWLAFLVVLFSCDFLRRQFGLWRFPNESELLLLWAGLHFLAGAVFILHAKWQLAWNFRALAAQAASPGWLERAARVFAWLNTPGVSASLKAAPGGTAAPAGMRTPPPG